MKRPSDSPVDVIVRLFAVNKFFQALGFALLYFAPFGPGAAAPPRVFPVVVGLSLAAVGQALNVGIYKAIGKNGVSPFGRADSSPTTVPWLGRGYFVG